MDLDHLNAWAKDQADKLFWANVDKDQAKLTAELAEWLDANGFCQDEDVFGLQDHEWIKLFLQRWDACSPILVDGVWMRHSDAKGK